MIRKKLHKNDGFILRTPEEPLNEDEMLHNIRILRERCKKYGHYD